MEMIFSKYKYYGFEAHYFRTGSTTKDEIPGQTTDSATKLLYTTNWRITYHPLFVIIGGKRTLLFVLYYGHREHTATSCRWNYFQRETGNQTEGGRWRRFAESESNKKVNYSTSSQKKNSLDWTEHHKSVHPVSMVISAPFIILHGHIWAVSVVKIRKTAICVRCEYRWRRSSQPNVEACLLALRVLMLKSFVVRNNTIIIIRLMFTPLCLLVISQ